MTAITAGQHVSVHSADLLHDNLAGTHQCPFTSAVRADRTDARWIVRVVLESDVETTAIRTIRVIVFDRDTGASVLHTVWSDWQDIPLLFEQVPIAPQTDIAPEAAATNLAAAILALLGGGPTACRAALRVSGSPPQSRGMSRRDRQYQQIVRDATWQDTRAMDMSATEAAQRQQTGRSSGEAD